jgi:hypothetical protein
MDRRGERRCAALRGVLVEQRAAETELIELFLAFNGSWAWGSPEGAV